MTLFQIGDELRAILELVDETGGELPPTLEQWFAEISQDEASKVESYYGLCKSLETEATVATAESEQFQAKAKARTNAVKGLKDRMKLYLENQGRKEAVGTSGRKACVQANGGKVALTQAIALNPNDMSAAEVTRCDERFLKPKVTLDTEAVRSALEAGEVIEMAKLEPRGTHLRWR